jgi:tetratricopeptide (TPR) repeat protein
MRYRWSLRSNQTILQLVLISSLLGSLFIAGCSNIPLPVDSGQSAPVASESILPVADSRELPAAILNLMTLADQQYFDNRVDDAIVTLERAIRIRPRYPEIWSRMAYIYAQLGKPEQAYQYAQRSNSYISLNPRLKPFNDELIASSRR